MFNKPKIFHLFTKKWDSVKQDKWQEIQNSSPPQDISALVFQPTHLTRIKNHWTRSLKPTTSTPSLRRPEVSGEGRTSQGLFPEDTAKSWADSSPPPALHPHGDPSTVGNTAAGLLQSLEARGVLLAKKLKLFGEDWLCGLCWAFPSTAPLPTSLCSLRWEALQRDGVQQERKCAVYSTVPLHGWFWQQRLQRLWKIPFGELIWDFLEEKLGKTDLFEMPVTSKPVSSWCVRAGDKH